ncbi:MAG: DUF4157 domain-containing protein [Nostoc sp. JL31]|nr:DUF4157 domain-containing protein [Nostoc sp. JL31]
MDGLLNSRLSHATRFGHNIANIPLRRPDTPTPIQPKLTIGEPGDKYEQEADDTARQVVQRIHQPQSEKLQRESLPEEDELQMKPESNIQRESLPEEDELQMKPDGSIQRESLPDEEDELQMKSEGSIQGVSEGGMAASPDLETSIQQARGGGQPLTDSVKSPMEQAFGADFSGVKVHTDTQADQLNQSIQAKAFTTGQDVFFRQGAYEPGSRGGQELLAHELTHVVHQGGRGVRRAQLPATGQAELTSPKADDRGNLEKGGLNFSYIQPIIQRAISLHQIEDADNKNPQGANPVLIRKTWIKGLVRQELTRIMQVLPNQTLQQVLINLEQSNFTASSLVNYELLPYFNGIDYTNSLTKEHILTINGFLNPLEQEMGMQKVAPKEIANMLVGNEFTFTNPSLESLKSKDKDELHKKMINPYNTIAQDWKNAMSQHGITPDQESTLDKMLHLTYKFKSTEHGLDWEYKVTPDQKCVEIITGKAKAGDLYSGHVGNLIDDYIFGIANSIGLQAHSTIGGGHINIDEKTAFGSYQENEQENAKIAAKVLANFIQEFYKDSAYWESIDPDTANSAFPKDLKDTSGKGKSTKTKQTDFEELIKKFNQEGWDVEKLADELMDKVFDQNLVNASKRESPHYQALNVEHLGNKTTGDTRRLEVRRVPAQPNRQALIEQLDRIATLLKSSKTAIQ